MPEHVGEVVVSTTTRFLAQCPSEEVAPPLGGFVAVDVPAGQALAVVSEIRAASIDPNRRPVAFGIEEEELFRQQPQLRELLATEFDAQLIGWHDGACWRQLLPPRPPRLHRFVYLAPAEAVTAVTHDGDWLRTLTAAELSDDFLAAAIRASLATGGDADALVAVGRTLARLLADDYDRLQVLLRRISG